MSTFEEPLLNIKLYVPQPRLGSVERARLLQRLEGALSTGTRLLLISAPAGFGKTTLLAGWAAHTTTPLAWLSLDSEDNDLTRFLAYMLAALRRLPGLGPESLQLPPSIPPQALLASLINQLGEVDAPFGLVLDDYQFISTPGVHTAVAYLLDHLPPAMHLFIAARSDPPLHLSRLRACGQMIELRADDLRFTEEETAGFLNRAMGLDLTGEDIQTLAERTEGWIAGLQMAGLALQPLVSGPAQRPGSTSPLSSRRLEASQFIQAFNGSHRYILDYLLEEVIQRQPDEVQTFLLHTSILDRLCGPLCDYVVGQVGNLSAPSRTPAVGQVGNLSAPSSTPAVGQVANLSRIDSQALLEHLDRSNLFIVPLDEERRWYRYHHLFADLLRHRLNLKADQDQIANLHRRASEWYEANGFKGEPVNHALAARDFPHAVRLLRLHWRQTVHDGHIATAFRWLDALPEDLLLSDPMLTASYCWLFWLTGQTSKLEARLVDLTNAMQRLEASGEAPLDDPEYAALPVQIAILQSQIAHNHGDLQGAIELVQRGLEIAGKEDRLLRGTALYRLASSYQDLGDYPQAIQAFQEAFPLLHETGNVMGATASMCNIAMLELVQGRLAQAEQTCLAAIQNIQKHGLGQLSATGTIYVALADVLRERNELEKAAGYLQQAIELGRLGGYTTLLKNSYQALSRLKRAQGDLPAAQVAIQEAESIVQQMEAPAAAAELAALRLRLAIEVGNLDEAARLAEELDKIDSPPGPRVDLVTIPLARLRMAQGRLEETRMLLSQGLEAAGAGGRLRSAIELHVLRALVEENSGRRESALADLERALEIAGPQCYRRVFIDEGAPVAELLKGYRSKATGSHRSYAGQLLTYFQSEETDLNDLQTSDLKPATLIDQLSDRELEVLHLLARGLTNREIAEQLFLAVGTIKTHIHNIHGKLGAQHRTQAIALAREMGLLQD